MHGETDTVSEMHCVSLCNFVHLSVLRSKNHQIIWRTASQLSAQNVLPCTGSVDWFFYLIKFLCNTLNTLQINTSKAKIHHSTGSAQSCSQTNKLKNIEREPKKFYWLQCLHLQRTLD